MIITAEELEQNLEKYLSLAESADIFIARGSRVTVKLTRSRPLDRTAAKEPPLDLLSGAPDSEPTGTECPDLQFARKC